eukprot:7483394-Alexandrium_andersonii.AAC.1
MACALVHASRCCRRAPHHASRIYKAWAAHRGVERADSVAKSLPPRALKGRWGSIDAVERKLLLAGKHDLELVWAEALVSKASKPRR